MWLGQVVRLRILLGANSNRERYDGLCEDRLVDFFSIGTMPVTRFIPGCRPGLEVSRRDVSRREVSRRQCWIIAPKSSGLLQSRKRSRKRPRFVQTRTLDKLFR